jgi:hypothetical protein
MNYEVDKSYHFISNHDDDIIDHCFYFQHQTTNERCVSVEFTEFVLKKNCREFIVKHSEFIENSLKNKC